MRGAELPLHLEAALALLDERLALDAPAPGMVPVGGDRSARRTRQIAPAPAGSATRTDDLAAQTMPEVTIEAAGPALPGSADLFRFAPFAVNPGAGGNWGAWGLSATGVLTFGAPSHLRQDSAASPTEAQTEHGTTPPPAPLPRPPTRT